jgi:hypothetical protein
MRIRVTLRQVALSVLFFLTAVGGARLAAQEEQPVTREIVISVLQEAFPNLGKDDIEVKLLKRLTSRVKVNLDIKGVNAILYLTWQRRGNSYQWWFEYNPERSLVYLSKTTGSAREVEKKPASAEPAAEPIGETARTETVEVGLEARQEKPESEGKKEPQPTAEPEKSVTEKPQKPEGEESTSESKPAETPAEFEMPPLEMAVSEGATSKQFLTALVGVLARGEEQNYPQFLLRSDEVAEEIKAERIDHLVTLWNEQCSKVHDSLQNAKRIEISKVVLQRARNEEVEQATIERLRKTVPTVREIYTDVRIELLLDADTAYIEIGGLMRLDNGWRVGGRMQLIRTGTAQPPTD